MSYQQSGKQGVVTDSQKRDGYRNVDEPAPSSAPVAGAFGREEGLESFPVTDRASVLAADEEDDDLEDDDDLDDDDDDFDDDEDDDDLDEDEDEE